MKKVLPLLSIILIIIIVLLVILNLKSNNVNIKNLKTDYLKSDTGEKITFYIPSGFTETDFVSKSDSWKGYNSGSASIDLQIVSKEQAESRKNSLLEVGFEEKNYKVNNKTYTKVFSKSSSTYLYKINEDTYYYVSDFRNSLTKKQINTFLTIEN